MHAPFAAGDKTLDYPAFSVVDQFGDVVSGFETYDTAEWVAAEMNLIAAKHLMVHGTRAEKGP